MRSAIHQLALCAATFALATASLHPAKLPLPNHIVHQFQRPTWIENIAIRHTGDLVLTQLAPEAALYTILHPATAPEAHLLHKFPPEIQGLTGITETTPDVFVVTGGNMGSGQYFAWSVDFNGSSRPVVKQITQLTGAGVPNGLCTLPWLRRTVLIADSALGHVSRLNTLTGKLDVATKVPEMAAHKPGGSGPESTGVNGIKIFKGYLYWSNSARAAIYRVRITGEGSILRGARVEEVAKLDVSFIDDFAIDPERGTLFVTTGPDNRVWALNAHINNKPPSPVVGATNQLTVAGNTAAALGRTSRDDRVLYITTNGAISTPVNGTLVEGGKVVAVDTDRFR